MISIGLLRRKPSLFALALGWLLSALLIQAQPAGTGSVQGRVYNPVSKEYVGNAEVRLDGTNQTTYTESDGSFSFSGVPAGTATVSVAFSGYNTAKDTFTVTAGQPAVREINLTSTAAAPAPVGKDGVVQLTAFTVASEREGNSKAIMAQRRNMNITTSVSSDIFGDVADGNVGEFLKYLPGVDLDYVESEPRGPRLGGMDGQYVGVSFDGMRTASADANRGGGAASRATSFEGFSITSIDSIEINRTASPENDADSPAGTVNMKTKRAFERKGRRMAFNYGINFNSEEFTLKQTPGPADYKEEKWKPNYQFEYAESFFKQRFGILLSASQSNSYTEQITMTNGYNIAPNAALGDNRTAVIRQIDFKDGPKFIRKDALLLTADWKATARLTLSLNVVYSYFDGEFWNRNFTFVAANDNANVNNGRSTVGGDAISTVIATRAPSGSVNNVSTLNNGGGSSAKLTYTRQFSPRFEYKIGDWVVDGALAMSRSVNNYESLERGFSNSEGGGVASSWIATRANPRSAEWTIRQTSGNDWLNLGNFTSTDSRAGGTRVSNDDRTWLTEKWTGTLNAKWPLPFMKTFPTSIKFGGKWDEETRKNNDRSALNTWSYIGPGGNTTTVNATTGANQNVTYGNWANVGPEFTSSNPFESGRLGSFTLFNINGTQGTPPRVSRNAVAALFHAHPELFVNTATPENYYTSVIANPRNFQQTVTAGYVQADMRLTSKLQIRYGIRLEETGNVFNELDPLSRAAVIAAGYPVNAPGTNSGRPQTIAGLKYQYQSQPNAIRKSNYQNWFPSLLLKYQILPNLEFQAGGNKGIARPAIDDLTGLWSIDETNQRVSTPNPKLLPEFHTVFQTRMAYYFGGASPGQASISFSQDKARNFIQNLDFSASEFGVDDPDFAAYTFRVRSNAPGEQRLRNMDISYNQTLGFLPNKYLRGLNVNFTYGRTYADVRRQGLSPQRVSSRLGYAYGRFNAAFGMIWAADKPESSTYGRYFGQITKFDLSASVRITRYVSLYVQGRNITNAKDHWYQSPFGTQEGKNGYLRSIEEYGANWVFGVKGQF
jgi:iron complex outermembrane receptor protein